VSHANDPSAVPPGGPRPDDAEAPPVAAPVLGEDAASATPPDTQDPGDAGGAPDACPYLAAPGGWRSTGAVRDHRCTALDPAAALALEKQRRLCLVAAHRTCPTYVAARAAREHALAGVPAGWEPERRLVRTAPVVIEAAPRRRGVPVSLGSHRLAEAAVALMALVVVVLVGSRILAGAPPEPTPRPTPVVTAGPTATAVAGAASAAPTAAPTSAAPSPEETVAATPSVEATAKPAASAERTYTVKAGDTLSAIGAKFGVAWQDIAKANKIKSPYRIVRGQVLVIP
jgi:LysM repeat protein